MADAALTLDNICLDVQIGICMCLHPSDILALRKTCRAFRQCTRQRIVWKAALYRACLENALFLPSFPMSDMSDLELEKAATAPRRWIELCRRLKEQDLNYPGAILRQRATIANSNLNELRVCDFFLVPGGRYLVRYLPSSISVWDLRHTSGACNIIASAALATEYDNWTPVTVHATPDGMGLSIFMFNLHQTCTIYEIFPESETPDLKEIAHLTYDLSAGLRASVLTGSVFVTWYSMYQDRVVFRVWDYRRKHSICFSAHFELKDSHNFPEVIATNDALIILCEEKVLIWAIPHLLLQCPDFLDHHPAYIPPLFAIPLPDPIDLQFLCWNTIPPWYFGSKHLYFDMHYRDSTLRRFRIWLEPGLSSASLQMLNTSQLDYNHWLQVRSHEYRVCEGSIFSCWLDDGAPHLEWGLDWSASCGARNQFECGVHTGLGLVRFAVSHSNPATAILPDVGRRYRLLSCPASGRFVAVLLDQNDHLVIFDF